MTANDTFGPHEHDGRQEDLKIISQWVRKELFVKVKFLYDIKEDLMVNGNIYKHFLRDCKDRLVGLRLNADRPSEYRRKYVESLWNQATKKKHNLVSDGLNARRSSIYSATQNRFIGKLKIDETIKSCTHLISIRCCHRSMQHVCYRKHCIP